MSETAVEIEVVTVDERAERILKYHDLQRDAFGQQMGYIFLAGYELHQQKEELPHGEYEKWRERNLAKISNRTALIYRGFAEGLISKSATVADLTGTLQLTQGSLSPEARQTVIEAVHTAADGKSLMEMYRELDLVRKPKKPTFTPPKKLSAKEQEEAANAEALHSFDLWLADGQQLFHGTDTFLRVLTQDTDRAKMGLEQMVGFTTHCRELLKAGATDSAASATGGAIKKAKRKGKK